jgi:hypothetical protein
MAFLLKKCAIFMQKMAISIEDTLGQTPILARRKKIVIITLAPVLK